MWKDWHQEEAGLRRTGLCARHALAWALALDDRLPQGRGDDESLDVLDRMASRIRARAPQLWASIPDDDAGSSERLHEQLGHIAKASNVHGRMHACLSASYPALVVR